MRIWTQKEAITKAIGHELQNSLKHINIPITKSNYHYQYNDINLNVIEFLRTETEIGTIAAAHNVDEIKVLKNPDVTQHIVN